MMHAEDDVLVWNMMKNMVLRTTTSDQPPAAFHPVDVQRLNFHGVAVLGYGYGDLVVRFLEPTDACGTAAPGGWNARTLRG